MGWKTETTIRQFVICSICHKEVESYFSKKKDAVSSFKRNGWKIFQHMISHPKYGQVHAICPECLKEKDGE